MDTIAKNARVFDAFAKPVNKTRGGPRSKRAVATTILISILASYIGYVEFDKYLGGQMYYEFSVDGSVQKEIRINLDVTVAMPCQDVTIHARDIAGDTHLVDEVVQFQDLPFFDTSSSSSSSSSSRAHVLTSTEQDQDPFDQMGFTNRPRKGSLQSIKNRKNRYLALMKEAEGGNSQPSCRIYASFKTNRLDGNLHITPRGFGYMPKDIRAGIANPAQFNFTHVFDELSFGDLYPDLNNPLDNVYAIATSPYTKYQYFVSLVPTTYKTKSTSFVNPVVSTMQYAVTEQSQNLDHLFEGHPKTPNWFQKLPDTPGIFITYQFEPISVEVSRDSRLPFFQFLVRLASIVGGLVISLKYVSNIASLLMNYFHTDR